MSRLILTKDEIDSIISDMESKYSSNPYAISVPEGWRELIAVTHIKLSEIMPGYVIRQVKSKFEGLRYYAEPVENAGPITRSIFFDIIELAENRSYYIDMDTGKPKFRKKLEMEIE